MSVIIIKNDYANVRSMNGAEYSKKLYITPDMTPLQHDLNKAICSRLKKMNQEEHRYQIKNGQIVLRGSRYLSTSNQHAESQMSVY